MPPFEEWFLEYRVRYEEVIEEHLREAFSIGRINYEQFCLSLEMIADSIDSFRTDAPFEIDYNMDGMSVEYVSWFLLRRAGDLAKFFVEKISESPALSVYDVGAGAGSVYLSLVIALDYLKENHVKVNYYCCDSSQIMLNEFGILRTKLPHENIAYCSESVVEFQEWEAIPAETYRVIIMSYLLGIKDDNERFREEVLALVNRVRADEIVITTSRRKYRHLYGLRGMFWSNGFESAGWDMKNSENLILPNDTAITHFRRGMYIGSGQINARRRALLDGRVPWKSEGAYMTNYLHVRRRA